MASGLLQCPIHGLGLPLLLPLTGGLHSPRASQVILNGQLVPFAMNVAVVVTTQVAVHVCVCWRVPYPTPQGTPSVWKVESSLPKYSDLFTLQVTYSNSDTKECVIMDTKRLDPTPSLGNVHVLMSCSMQLCRRARHWVAC